MRTQQNASNLKKGFPFLRLGSALLLCASVSFGAVSGMEAGGKTFFLFAPKAAAAANYDDTTYINDTSVDIIAPEAASAPAVIPLAAPRVTPDEAAKPTEQSASCASILIDGRVVATMYSASEAKALLQSIIQAYKPHEGNKLVKATFVQKVEILEESDPASVLGADEAYLTLVNNKGLLSIQAIESRTESEKIPYKTETQNDATLNSGTTKQKQKGKDGVQESVYEITYTADKEIRRELISKTVKEEPVNEIILKGTKKAASSSSSSSSSGGSSSVPSSGPLSFAYPLRAPISSYFGSRWGSTHEGLDLSAKSGTPFGAGEAGTVTFAASSGNYGLMIEIDHGGGFTTRYAHCSSLLVKVGDKVAKGQTIGLVGSTGRSTGPHVHYEIRYNGKAYDPLKYL